MKSSVTVIINLSQCSNKEALLELMGPFKNSGQVATGHETYRIDRLVDDLYMMAIPGASLDDHVFRTWLYSIGLLAHDNLGPLTIDPNGDIWLTKSDSSVNMITAHVGYISADNLEGEYTIIMENNKAYGIIPVKEEGGRIYVDEI